LALLDADDDCMANDKITIYKYTIASSKSTEDATWAGEMFGCTLRDVTDAHGCAELGKTVCLANSLAYNLHFVSNKVTPTGDKDVAYWDDYAAALHGDLSRFNGFMNYRMTFYAKSLDALLEKQLDAGADFMLRTTAATDDDVAWYSLLLMSPSGKMFEVTSTRLNLKKVGDHAAGKAFLASTGGEVRAWADEKGVCAFTQAAGTLHTVAELDAFYDEFNSPSGTANPVPVRNQIAVASVAKTKAWWGQMFPSVALSEASGNTDTCQALSFSLEAYTAAGFRIETRFIQNDEAAGAKDVRAFVAYVEAQHAAYTGPNKGWDAWYDRHLGIMCTKCSLDKYMSKFFKNDVSFMPHGRDEVTENTGVPTQHCWTEGVQGYGLEMQGAYDFSFRPCYTVFDWCQADSMGEEFCQVESER
jgi:hypothetical protein